MVKHTHTPKVVYPKDWAQNQPNSTILASLLAAAKHLRESVVPKLPTPPPTPPPAAMLKAKQVELTSKYPMPIPEPMKPKPVGLVQPKPKVVAEPQPKVVAESKLTEAKPSQEVKFVGTVKAEQRENVKDETAKRPVKQRKLQAMPVPTGEPVQFEPGKGSTSNSSSENSSSSPSPLESHDSQRSLPGDFDHEEVVPMDPYLALAMGLGIEKEEVTNDDVEGFQQHCRENWCIRCCRGKCGSLSSGCFPTMCISFGEKLQL